MRGQIGSTDIELLVLFTPKTKKAWKFVVYLPKQSTWYALKSQYKEYLEMLIGKYGQPKNEYHFFSSPYEDGDGYEMTAVTVEKCTYAAYWEDTYSIEISKYSQVKIAYENPINTEIYSQEKKQIQTNSF